MSTVTKCNEQATVVGLSLTTLGDGGSAHVLSTVDRHLLITLGVQLCTERWA